MSEKLLAVENLSVEFNKFIAVNNVSMTVEKGEMRVIIGPNGAGKTTLMDLVTGKTKPSSGRIHFDGQDITGKDASIISQKYGIGRKFQNPNVFDQLTVYENIEVALTGYTAVWKSFLYRRSGRNKERIGEVLNQIKLWEKRDLIAASISHGQRQWLEIGMVMAQDPKLIILDEPTAGMTAAETWKTGEMMLRLLDHHTVIVVEHDMAFVRQVAQKVTVMHQGALLAEGPFEKIEKDPRVIQVYLKDNEEDIQSCFP